MALSRRRIETVDVSVTSQPNGGIDYFDRTVNFILSSVGAWQSSIPKCGGPCDVYTATAEFAGIELRQALIILIFRMA